MTPCMHRRMHMYPSPYAWACIGTCCGMSLISVPRMSYLTIVVYVPFYYMPLRWCLQTRQRESVSRRTACWCCIRCTTSFERARTRLHSWVALQGHRYQIYVAFTPSTRTATNTVRSASMGGRAGCAPRKGCVTNNQIQQRPFLVDTHFAGQSPEFDAGSPYLYTTYQRRLCRIATTLPKLSKTL